MASWMTSTTELERLLAGEGPALLGLARALVQDPGRAEDAVQDTMLVALQRRPAVAELGPWLRGVLRNVLRQDRRTQTRRERRERAAARPEGEEPVDESRRLATLEQLLSALRGLPEPYRSTVSRRYLDGENPARIAAALGIPAATVRSRCQRGLEQLRAQLDRSAGGRSAWMAALVPCLAPPTSAAGWGSIGVWTMSSKSKIAVAAGILVALTVSLWSLSPFGDPPPDPQSFAESAERAKAAILAKVSEPPPTAIPEPAAEVQRTATAEEDASLKDGWVRYTGTVRDLEGAPIAGARVWEFDEGVRSDDQGRFVLDGRSRGMAFVHAEAAGFSAERAVVQGSESRRHQFDIVLKPEFRIEGRVVDEHGRAVANAEVDTFYNYGESVRTDAAGEFSLGHLDPGRPKHSLRVKAQGFLTHSTDVVTHGDSTREDVQLARGGRVTGIVVDAATGDAVRDVEIFIGFDPNDIDRMDAEVDEDGLFEFPVVGPGPQTLMVQHANYAAQIHRIHVPDPGDAPLDLELALGGGRAVKGRIVDGLGNPLPGVSISTRVRNMRLSRRATTDAQGAFRIESVPESELRLSTYLPGYQRLGPMEVAAGSDTELDTWTMDRAGVLRGQVVDGRSGQPVRSFTVRLFRPRLEENDVSGYQGGVAATWVRQGHRYDAADGRFVSDADFRQGTVFGVEILADGYAPARLDRVAVASQDGVDETLFQLYPGTRLQGMVRDLDGAPIAGARIKVIPRGDSISANDSDDTHGRRQAETDPTGRFQFSGMGAGRLTLLVEADGYPPTAHGPLEIAAGQEVLEEDIRLDPGLEVAGTVRDAAGQPVAGARVQARTDALRVIQGLSWETTSDEAGGFRFAGLPRGALALAHLKGQGTLEQVTAVHYLNLERSRLDLELAPTTGLLPVEIRVTLDDRPMRDPVRLELVQGEERILVGRWVTQDGTLKLPGLPAGEYHAEVDHRTGLKNEKLAGELAFTVAPDGQVVGGPPVLNLTARR